MRWQGFPSKMDDGSCRLRFGNRKANVTSGIERMLADNNRMRLLQHEMTEQVTHFNTHVVTEGQVYDHDGVSVTAFVLEYGTRNPITATRSLTKGTQLSSRMIRHFIRTLSNTGRGLTLSFRALRSPAGELEQADPQYVNHFYSFLANPEVVGKAFSEI